MIVKSLFRKKFHSDKTYPLYLAADKYKMKASYESHTILTKPFKL